MATNGNGKNGTVTRAVKLAVAVAGLIGMIGLGAWNIDGRYAKAADVKVQIAGMEVLYLQAQIRNARQERRNLINQRNDLLDVSDRRSLTTREKRRLRQIEQDIRDIEEDIRELQRQQRERRKR